MNWITRFKSLPKKSKNLLGLGLLFALVVALPLFIWAIVTQKFLIFQRAAETSIFPPAPECGYCGGVGNIPCQDGLICKSQYQSIIYPDGQGVCQKPDNSSDCTLPLPTAPTFYCVKHAPTLEIIPVSQPGSPGSTLIYTAKVTNNDEVVLPGTPDASVCQSLGNRIAGRLPEGWTGVFNVLMMAVPPMKSGTVDFKVTSPSSPAPSPGPYQFTVDLNTPQGDFLTSANASYEILSVPNTNPPLCVTPTLPSGYLTTGTTQFDMAFYAAGAQGDGSAIDGYRWDFDGNGSWDQTSVGSTNTNFHFRYTSPGSYHPVYQVHNNSGIWSTNCPYPVTLTVTSPTTSRTFNILVKFDGVSGDSASGAKVNVRFVGPSQGTSNGMSTGPVEATYTENGIYLLSFNVNPSYLPAANDYALILKGEKHAQVKFCDNSGQTQHCKVSETGRIIVPSGNSGVNYNFTGIPLPAGDTYVQDGYVNAIDYDRVRVLTEKPHDSLTEQDKLVGDLDYNDYINARDILLLRRTLETRYDEY